MEYKNRITRDGVAYINSKIRQIKALNKDLIILDRMNYICNDLLKECYSINTQLEKYFYDYGHHTLVGAKFFGKRVDETNWLRDVINSFEK